MKIARALQLVWTALAYLLLLAPILVLILASFDEAKFFRFPPQTLSLHWYEAAAASGEYRSALSASAIIALCAGTISILVGSLAAYALARFTFPGKRLVEAVLLAPLVLPLIVWAIALLQIYAALGMSGTLAGLVLAHAVITVPYTVRIMVSTFERIDPNLEAAAASLGAPPLAVARRITIPLAMPGLATSAAFSLLISFNDVIVSSLIAGARWITFPVRLFAQLRSEGVDPITLAIGATIIAVILLAAIVGEYALKWSRHL
ncbi:polyamine ABC transporter permease [Kaistia algarum]|uniref:ABC transporter permease n=1 Tax=Kaistia algarum TaxID=2083279 RepID=UPI000CE8B340|nr:ABC transporter permease [Kaistia algarum]MCX5512916.1 ABC transporter permease [Kaistia algarum]PPE81596.1 polyamine ABC transporter permease [Kaistia algarum]